MEGKQWDISDIESTKDLCYFFPLKIGEKNITKHTKQIKQKDQMTSQLTCIIKKLYFLT